MPKLSNDRGIFGGLVCGEQSSAVGILSATLWREIEGERVAIPSVEPATVLGCEPKCHPCATIKAERVSCHQSVTVWRYMGRPKGGAES